MRHKDTNGAPARADIQGMRALAVAAVVLYHADVPFISGGFVGVDFFFVLSGFLITGLLVREIEKTHRINLAQFWGRRARRLIPASALVLVVTVIAAGKILPFAERKGVAADALWATFFGSNWRFAQQQTDYLDAERAASPFQHFWSLGVEEQFYLAAPLVFVAAAIFMRRRIARTTASRRAAVAPRLLLGVVLAIVLVASLAYCVHLSAANQPYAFFGTHARAWQLAAGGLLALAVPRLKNLGRVPALSASVAGFALFGVSVFVLSEGGAVGGYVYPSVLAIIPTAAAVLLLIGGVGGPTVPTRVLSARPLTMLGDISYSLYLWHWPFIVLGVIYFDNTSMSMKLALAAASVVAATATYLLIENPVRHSKALMVTHPIVSVAIGVVMLGALVPVIQHMGNQKFVITATKAPTAQPAATPAPGSSPAAPATPVVDDTIVGLTPAVDRAEADGDDMLEIGCGLDYPQDDVPDASGCTWGAGDKRVVVLGDSIAAASVPGIREAARTEGWKVTAWTKSACPIADVVVHYNDSPGEFVECETWRDSVLDKVIAAKPGLVVLGISNGSLNKLVRHTDGRQLTGKDDKRREGIDGLDRTVRRLQNAGVRVAIVDSPDRAPFKVASCLMEKQSVSACSWKRSTQTSIANVVAKKRGTLFVAATDQYCDTTCSPVVGRTVAIRDNLHFTATFSKRLAPLFATMLAEASVA